MVLNSFLMVVGDVYPTTSTIHAAETGAEVIRETSAADNGQTINLMVGNNAAPRMAVICRTPNVIDV
ncbi:hypothetical protein [Synechococcus sp. RS9902]|uniref:hypothetical protein n=1 Tax=Synechococcus sp. RS9902 TaxID=221345 RepID=UPI0016491E73|nr:hypothetical protein [Synechococcus sp. RS9902]